MLIACFIIKLAGGNWFEVAFNNKHFISICQYIDTHLVLNYLIAFPIYAIPAFIAYMACSMTTKPNIKQFLLMFCFIIVSWASQFISPYIKFILEALGFVIIPFCVQMLNKNRLPWKQTLKRTWYLGFIGCTLTFIFQVLSLITKNIGLRLVEENSLLSWILMIDYYLMVVLYFLYVKLKQKKEEQANG